MGHESFSKKVLDFGMDFRMIGGSRQRTEKTINKEIVCKYS